MKPADVRRSILIAWPAAVALIGAIAFLLVDRNPAGLIRPCALRALTGVPCPACGTTRALRDLFAGRAAAAFASNPLAAAAAVLTASSAVISIVVIPWADRARGYRPRLRRSRLVWIGAGLVVANWIYLIVSALR